ncbi:MAG: Gfo/Idh/MocA family oxidoreductase [Balneolaceae bacterium]
MEKVNWGILSTANIAVKNVIPSMQKGEYCTIKAISSRNLQNAKLASETLGIENYYGSYEELLTDPDIDAVYNPLPNHLHVPWTIKALEAGKHVLCEKPISITSEEALKLLEVSKEYPDLKVMEAFMYRFHPQWEKVKQVINSGEIGEITSIHSVFTYFNNDPKNVRNQADIGGGALLDVGCYCINLSRYIFESEPIAVKSGIKTDPDFNTDIQTTGVLEFEQGIATFMCSTQLDHNQGATIYGTKGFIEMNIPFNSANENKRKVWVSKAGDKETFFFDTVDQYTLQGDAFSKAVLDDTPVPTTLEDAVSNMVVIDKLFSNS